MRPALICTLIAATALAGCAQIQASPLNPFKRNQPQAVAPQEIRPLVPQNRIVRTVDSRPLVARVTDLRVTPVDGGVLVEAQGSVAQSGAYSAQLVQKARSNGTIVLEFRSFQGAGAGGQTVSTAQFISNGALIGITRIQVVAAGNTLSRRSN